MGRQLAVIERAQEEDQYSPTRSRGQRLSAEGAVFLGLLALYLAVAAWLVFGQHSLMEDALSRVANASHVIYSREPKLANVGFVWTPLPSLLMMPFLPLKYLWPALVEQGFLANVMSALAMAASARALSGLLGVLGAARKVRIGLAIAFGLQPMIIWFGANGMTEALLILFLVLTARELVQWLADNDFRHLMAAGAYLALGYLTRYEMLAAGCAAIAFVGAVTWWRTGGGRVARRQGAFADVLLLAAPLVAAFTLWAVASWVIVGHPFDQFTSPYGNSALVASGGGKSSIEPTLLPIQWLVLAPLFPLAAILVVVEAVRRRDLSIVPPAGLFLAVLAFEAMVYLAGSLFGFLRYQIVVIPLFVTLVGYLLRQRNGTVPASLHQPATAHAPLGATGARAARPGRRRGWMRLAPLVVALAMIPGILTSAYTFMYQREYASQEWGRIRPAVLATMGYEVAPGSSSNGAFDTDQEIAAFLDAKRLPPGSVVIDSGSGFAVIAASANPRQFVITSDRDFHGAVTDPVGHNVRYLLLNAGPSQFDEVAATWPDLAAGTPKAFWAQRAVVFQSGGQPGAHEWTLWQVEP
jgi:hypothetical protein